MWIGGLGFAIVVSIDNLFVFFVIVRTLGIPHDNQRSVLSQYGLAAVLGFSAAKLATARWIEISPILSIGTITGCIGATIWPSIRALKTAAA